jgi:hypothetical protein
LNIILPALPAQAPVEKDHDLSTDITTL